MKWINFGTDSIVCLLTGISALQIENYPLSEAIVGVHVLNTEEFVRVIGFDLEALHSMERNVLQQQFKLADFRAKQIYPAIWATMKLWSFSQNL